MKNKRILRLFTATILSIALLSPSAPLSAEETVAAAATTNSDYLHSVMDMIKDKYNGSISDKKLVEGSVKGMFDTMDRYTTFFTPEEADSYMGNINGSYTGIGIAMEIIDEYIIVTKIFAGSPAEAAGILKGDKLIEADGKSFIGKNTDYAASLILGKEGTTVKLGILRTGNKNTLYINLKRAEIKINPVVSEIRNGIGYIKLEMFNSNAGEYFSQALEKMDRNNIKKIIFDLRGNPGGEVGQAITVARNFVPKGIIATLDFNSASFKDTVYDSYLEKSKYKLAVLVDGSSASASEIVAGAIQDTKAGTLIGTKTFGKAKVQSILPVLTQEAFEKYSKQLGTKIADGFDLQVKYGIPLSESDIAGYTKITTGYYYTPNGRMIDGKGLIPDITVADPKAATASDGVTIPKLSEKVNLKTGSSGAEVYHAERMLKLLGYDVGAPDMMFDEKTKNAVIKFQATSKITRNGMIGPITGKALNTETEKTLLKVDLQYAKAVELLIK